MTHAAMARETSKTSLTMRRAPVCLDLQHQHALVLAVNAECRSGRPLCCRDILGGLGMHLVLLPFNAWRLLQALQVLRVLRANADTSPQPVARTSAGVLAIRNLAASMRGPAFDARATAQTIRLGRRIALL